MIAEIEPESPDGQDADLHERHRSLCDDKLLKPLWIIEQQKRASKNFDVSYASVLKEAQQLSLFVDIDEEVLGGTPRIRSTRIPVYAVLHAIEDHGTIDGATKAYRSLTVDAVKDALLFAANVLESPSEYKTPHFD